MNELKRFIKRFPPLTESQLLSFEDMSKLEGGACQQIAKKNTCLSGCLDGCKYSQKMGGTTVPPTPTPI